MLRVERLLWLLCGAAQLLREPLDLTAGPLIHIAVRIDRKARRQTASITLVYVRWEIELSRLHALHLALRNRWMQLSGAILVRHSLRSSVAVGIRWPEILMRGRRSICVDSCLRSHCCHFCRLLWSHWWLSRLVHPHFIWSGRLQPTNGLLCRCSFWIGSEGQGRLSSSLAFLVFQGAALDAHPLHEGIVPQVSRLDRVWVCACHPFGGG